MYIDDVYYGRAVLARVPYLDPDRVEVLCVAEYLVSPTLDPNLEQDSYFKLNGRIALSSQEGAWDVALVLENLTDEEILNFGNQVPLSTIVTGDAATAYYAFYEAPFNATLRLRYNF